MRSKTLFLLCFVACQCLCADEETKYEARGTEKEEESSARENAADASSLVMFEGAPSAMVAGMVNAISGTFHDVQTDLVVPGAEPITFQRSYTNALMKRGLLGQGWNFNHHTTISVKRGIRHMRVKVRHGPGAKTRYKGAKHSKSKRECLELQSSVIERGFTNCGGGTISGRTNLKNSQVFLRRRGSSQDCVMRYGNGSELHFSDRKNGAFHIEKEIKPSKNILEYRWTQQGRRKKIEGITAHSSDHKLIGKVQIKYPQLTDLMKKTFSMEVIGSNAQKVLYHFESHTQLKTGSVGRIPTKKHFRTYFLTEVERPDGINEKYTYENVAHNLSKRVIRKDRPEGRSLSVNYYKMDTNTVGNEFVKVRKGDVSHRRVSALWSPVGVDSHQVITHRFFYEEGSEIVNGEKEKYLKTKVFDALDQLTAYYSYKSDDRLARIEHYQGQKKQKLYSRERFFWGNPDLPDFGNLTCRTVEDHKGNILCCRTLDYDLRGNVTNSTLYGNLTGSTKNTIQLSALGIPRYLGSKSAPESYSKKYKYTRVKENWNLLAQENDGQKEIQYTYHAGTDLVASKLTLASGKIISREFYEYNKLAVLCKEIIDDGKTPNQNDLSGVTERRIKEIQTTLGGSTSQGTIEVAGLPTITIEKYLDPRSGHEVPLSKTVKSYTPQGWVTSEDYYDANNRLVYTKRWEYDKWGNLILEQNALGQLTTRKYDANKNLIFEQGPNPDYHKELLYDYANRLISEEIVQKDGKRLVVSQHYDRVGNKIKKVDMFGNETSYEYDALGRITQTKLPKVLGPAGKLVHPIASTEYDPLGNPIVQIHPDGNKVTSTFTIRGKPIETHYPDGTREVCEYNLDGTLKRSIAKNGSETRNTYDALNRLISTEIFSPSGKLLKRSKTTYNAFHITAEIDPMGNLTEYFYDGAGRPTCITKGEKKTEFFLRFPWAYSPDTRYVWRKSSRLYRESENL